MRTTIQDHLQADDAALEARWQRLAEQMQERFGQDVTIEALLFLIGVQSRGQGYEPKLGKETKQNLIMEGTYCAFETLGLYQRVGMETDGYWIWERTNDLPEMAVEAQEKLLRTAILLYFDAIESNPIR